MDQIAYNALTPRERDCLRLAGNHLKALEIADRLGLSEGYVENVLKKARAKLGGTPRHVAARELLAFEAVHFVDVHAMDLPGPAIEMHPHPSRPNAGANALREERTTFVYEQADPVASDRRERSDRLQRLVLIAALVVSICAVIGLAYPVAEGWQHLANLFAQPHHHQ